jgi:hypothetical protein
VQRVARKYLTEDQSTTGWFVPLPDAGQGNGQGNGQGKDQGKDKGNP